MLACYWLHARLRTGKRREPCAQSLSHMNFHKKCQHAGVDLRLALPPSSVGSPLDESHFAVHDFSVQGIDGCYDRGEPTANVLSTDGFPLMVGPNFQLLDGNPTVISILRQLDDELENVPEI